MNKNQATVYAHAVARWGNSASAWMNVVHSAFAMTPMDMAKVDPDAVISELYGL